jgi:hypothetical protein
MITGSVKSQKLTGHEWKNRLVLILTDDTSNVKYQDQLNEFQSDINGLKERKILIYQITPSEFKLGLTDGKWQKSETVYNFYKTTDVHPEIVLIGLDGGVKLNAQEFITNQKLFATIDVMPMRRQEIKSKKNR